MSGALEGRAVLITGAAGGIGRATALRLAREGARLVIDDLGCGVDGMGSDDTVAEAVAAAVCADGGDAVATNADVTKSGTAEKLVALCRDRWGRIDGVVGCAGVSRDRGILHLTDDDLDVYLSTHVRAAFELTRAAARAMIDQDEGGAIVHMTAPAAFFGSARKTGMAAAAAAIVGLTRSSAAELRKHQIRVNAVAPTARTRATKDLPMFQGVSAGSMSPDHVAPVVVHLLTDAAKDVFGEVVGVAGGRLYALRARETAGVFSEGRPFTLQEIADGWTDAMRGPVGGR